METFDLTHRLEPGMPVYPGDPPVAREPWATHETDGYRVARLSLGTHAGTHLDAPAHTEPDPDAVPGPYTVDAIPVESLRWRARLVGLTTKSDREAVRPGDLPPLDGGPDGSDGGPEGRKALDALLLWTGWERHWGTSRYRDHPFLAPETATVLADSGLNVALDAFSPDPTPDTGAAGEPTADEPAAAHHALLGSGSLVVENLAGVAPLADALAPGQAFTLAVSPLPVADGDGAPTRVVATLE